MKMFLFPRKIKGKLTNLIWEWKVEKEVEGGRVTNLILHCWGYTVISTVGTTGNRGWRGDQIELKL